MTELSGSPDLSAELDCPALQGDSPGLTAGTGIGFQNPTSGRTIGDVLEQFTDTTIEAAIQVYANLATTCPAVQFSGAGVTINLITTSLSPAKIGDETVGVRMTASFATLNIYVDIIAVRYKDTLIVANNIYVSSTPDDAGSQAVAQKSFDLVAARW